MGDRKLICIKEVRNNKQKLGSICKLKQAWTSASTINGKVRICFSNAEEVNLKVYLGMTFREKKGYLQVGTVSLAELI